MELEAESMSVEWTDEKHSLYLKSMEASFVNELYDSMELLGWCSSNNHLSHSKSTKQTQPNPSASPAQVWSPTINLLLASLTNLASFFSHFTFFFLSLFCRFFSLRCFEVGAGGN